MIVVKEAPGRIAVRCGAKLNLFLEVKGSRSDGYHEIETVLQEVAIYDDLEIERLAKPIGESRVHLVTDAPRLAPPGENLVEKAAQAFLVETGVDARLRIVLRKRIPAGAGLGGGSSDAVATLLALRRLLEAPLPEARMLRIAETLGSDCPFFVRGGAAIGRERGERVVSLELPRRVYFIVVPPLRCATSAVYAALDRRRKASLNAESGPPRIPNVNALREHDRDRFERALFNRLEEVAFDEFPALADFANRLERNCNTPFHLTGSGSGLFAVCERRTDANRWNAACQAAAEIFTADAGTGDAPQPTSVLTFVAESLEQRPY